MGWVWVGEKGRRSALFCLIDSLNYDSPPSSSLVRWRALLLFLSSFSFIIHFIDLIVMKRVVEEKEEQKHLYKGIAEEEEEKEE